MAESEIYETERAMEKERPTGLSINIGLNSVDPSHYGGWDGALTACEFDARDMYRIAQRQGFRATLMLTREATAERVTEAISRAADELESGDILFLSYSGHGGQVPDLNSDETDELDETWALYDRELVDDELFALWGRFKRGVRIFMLSDSCHSGTMSKQAEYRALLSTELRLQQTRARRRRAMAAPGRPRGAAASGDFSANVAVRTPLPRITRRVKTPPQRVQSFTYNNNQSLYDGIQKSHPAGDRVEIQATVMLISGCMDNQLSSDGLRNGLFTGVLRRVWRNGAFQGGYRRFHRQIRLRMPGIQSPNFSIFGQNNPGFESQRPFTV